MAEWFKAPVLKTDVPNGTVGSNPTSTAISPCSLAVKHLTYIQHRLQIRERHRFESCRGYQVFRRLKALAFSLNCVFRYVVGDNMIAEPVKKDFTVPQGVTYPIKMRWLDSTNTPISLSGATVRAQLRKQFEETTPAIDCTIANGKAFLEVDTWFFGFTLLPEDTAAIEPTTYFYDILVTLNGDVTRAMQGTISLTPRVTRA